AQDELVFDEFQHVKTRRTDNALDFLIVAFEVGRAAHDLEAIADLQRQYKRLQAALALERDIGLGPHLDEAPARRRALALQRPLHLRIGLRRQACSQAL